MTPTYTLNLSRSELDVLKDSLQATADSPHTSSRLYDQAATLLRYVEAIETTTDKHTQLSVAAEQ